MIIRVEHAVSTQNVGMTLGQGKTQSESLAIVVDLGKEHKDAIAVGLSNAPTRILYDEADGSVGQDDAHHDMLTVRLLHGIEDNLAHAICQELLVRLDREGVWHLALESNQDTRRNIHHILRHDANHLIGIYNLVLITLR